MMLRTFSHWRWWTIAAFMVLTIIGLLWHQGWGTLSSFGWKSFAYLCPLGGLETLLAGHSVTERSLIGCLIAVVLVVLLGRVFCGWICPTPLLKKLAGVRTPSRYIPIYPLKQSSTATEHNLSLSRQPSTWMLIGALGASALFGFPVFCLICPVGLTFAVIVGFWQITIFHTADWSLLFGATILGLEILVFKKWCHQICPLGAIMRLLASFNRLWLPMVNPQRCLRSQKVECNVCRVTCPEQIDLTQPLTGTDRTRCTKCHACAEACPSGAIHFGRVHTTTPVSPTTTTAKSLTITPRQKLQQIAQNCVLCGNCETVCPMHNPITLWMRALQEGKLRAITPLMLQAGQWNDICARVCPSELLCEKACAAHHSAPLPIRHIEQTLADMLLTRGDVPHWPKKTLPCHVAIVGAGPAGLACADVLNQAGVRVTVYDDHSRVGGLLTHGLPYWRFDSKKLALHHRRLEENGVEFRLGERIGETCSYRQLLDAHDSVVLASGLPQPIELSTVPMDLPGVKQAISLLQEVNTIKEKNPQDKSFQGQRALVVGGGETAMDCVETLLRTGATHVDLSYRGDRTHLKMSPQSIARLATLPVTCHFHSQVEQILRDENQTLTGVRLTNGQSINVDLIVLALGFTSTPHSELQNLGVQWDTHGRILTPVGHHQTAHAKLFVCGDLRLGPALVSQAVADGVATAQEVLSVLQKHKDML